MGCHMDMCRRLSCKLLALVALSPAAFAAIDPAGTQLDEVVVTGRQLDVLRKEHIRTEDEFFDRYNTLIGRQEYQVHCRVEQPLGSRVPRSYCRAGYEDNAVAQAGREAVIMLQYVYDSLRRGAPPVNPVTTTTVAPSSIAARRADFQRQVREVVIRDPQLLQTLVRHAQLMDRYNRVQQELFGSRRGR